MEYSAHGMIWRRSSSVGACRLRASVTGSSKSQSLRMAAGSPTVLTVILRALIPMPHGALSVRMAFITALAFASGSPMPMNTTLEMRPTPGCCARRQTCSTMRPVVRLPSTPSRPDAQNLQPTGQPIWLETHAVRRSSLGIITHSVSRPVATPSTGSDTDSPPGAGQPTSSLRVPSVASRLRSSEPCRNTISWASMSRLAFERLVIRSMSTTPLPYTQSISCLAANLGMPRAPHQASRPAASNSKNAACAAVTS